MAAANPGLSVFLKRLPADDRRLVELAATPVRIGHGEVFVGQDEAANRVHILLTGMAFRARALTGGRRQIIGLLVPGDCFDLQECMRERSGNSYIAVAACTVAAIPRDAILAWVESRPAIARLLWRWAAQREAILSEWLLDLGSRSSTERMAHLFCELLVRLRAVGLAIDNAYDLPLRQADLAEIAGLSTVHVNRTLQTLRGEKLIAFRNQRLKVLDVARLAERAGFESGYLELAAPGTPDDQA